MNVWGHDTVDDQRIPEFLLSVLPVPFSSLVRVDFAARSDRGKVRDANEDSFLIYRTSRQWERLLTSLPEDQLPTTHSEVAYVMSVADGMGGHRGGQVASSLALRTGVALVLNAARWSLKLDCPSQREQEIELMISRGVEIFQEIDRAIAEQAIADPSLSGMGTTLTVTYSLGDDLFILHIGDSRAYLYREGTLRQLTRDHTLVQAMLDAGTITPEQAAHHSMRHVLTRAMGRGRESRAEIHHLPIQDGDVLMLCSDGLHGMVDDTRIAAILTQQHPADATCQILLDEALANGGRDNITVLVARYSIPPRPKSPGST